MPLKSKSAGQGTLESVLALPLIFLFVCLLAQLMYRGAIYYFADYHLHEGLICLDHESLNVCERELSMRFKKILLFSEKTEIRLQQTSRSYSGEITVHLKPQMDLQQTRGTSL